MAVSLLKNPGKIVTPRGNSARFGEEMDDLEILENKDVLIEDGFIKEIGERGAYDGLVEDETDVINVGGKPVLPGFVDPHTHFVFAGYRADEFNARLRGASYEEIARRGGGIVSSVSPTREASLEELKEISRERSRSVVRHGVTTIEGKTGYGLNKESELKQLRTMTELDDELPIDIVPTFLGAHVVPKEYEDNREGFVELLLDEVIPAAANDGAEFCDVFCDEGAFTLEESRKILNAGKRAGMTPKIHADEIEATGAAGLAAEVGAISADHLLKSSDSDLKALRDNEIVAVLLPITAFSLKEEYARGRWMIDNGLAVSIATDLNPGSCYSESVPLLFSLATLYMGLTIEEAITALTLNGAAAVNRADEVGTIEPGKKGDFVILDAPDYEHLSYHIGVSLVDKVVKQGQVIWERSEPGF